MTSVILPTVSLSSTSEGASTVCCASLCASSGVSSNTAMPARSQPCEAAELRSSSSLSDMMT